MSNNEGKTWYSKQLEHPQWQLKRLEIIKERGAKCEKCGASDKMLHVHHKEYLSGHAPWEYPNDNFECLCVTCHKAQTFVDEAIKSYPNGEYIGPILYALVRKKLMFYKTGWGTIISFGDQKGLDDVIRSIKPLIIKEIDELASRKENPAK